MVMKVSIQLGKTCVKIEFGFVFIIAVSLLLHNENILYVLLFSMLHELGHIIALIIFGSKPDCIVLSYYGIGMRHSADLTYIQEIIFLLLGILINAAFAALNICRDINIVLFVINALPLYPLDGGRVVKLIMINAFGYNISDKVYLFISIVLIIAMLAFSLYHRNVSVLVITIYITVFSLKDYFN